MTTNITYKHRSRNPNLSDGALSQLLNNINQDLDRSIKHSKNMKRLIDLAPFMSARHKLKCLDLINFVDDDGIEVNSPRLLKLLYEFMQDEKVDELASRRL